MNKKKQFEKLEKIGLDQKKQELDSIKSLNSNFGLLVQQNKQEEITKEEKYEKSKKIFLRKEKEKKELEAQRDQLTTRLDFLSTNTNEQLEKTFNLIDKINEEEETLKKEIFLLRTRIKAINQEDEENREMESPLVVNKDSISNYV